MSRKFLGPGIQGLGLMLISGIKEKIILDDKRLGW
jgi:hypothetical protein